MHELQPLARDFHAQARHAGEITSRPRQAVHHSKCDRVATHLKDNRDRRSRRFRRERDRSAAGRGQYGYLPADEIGRERRQSIVLAFRPSILDRDIATLDISAFGQTFLEGLEATGKGPW